jgi:cell division transport system permease protein
MQLVGATKGFIRRPFVIKGIMQGIYAGIIAVALLVGLLYFAQREIPELLYLQDEQLIAILFGFVILLGILISWFSTFLAVRKYLRLKTDDLY